MLRTCVFLRHPFYKIQWTNFNKFTNNYSTIQCWTIQTKPTNQFNFTLRHFLQVQLIYKYKDFTQKYCPGHFRTLRFYKRRQFFDVIQLICTQTSDVLLSTSHYKNITLCRKNKTTLSWGCFNVIMGESFVNSSDFSFLVPDQTWHNAQNT